MRCPFATWIGSPNFGYPRGSHGQNHPIAIVDHVMQGYLAGCDSWFRNPDSWSSTHFGIGKDGLIHQYVDTDDAAWANGAVNKPSLLGADLAIQGNPNVLTISIEHEGFSGEEWTEAMYQANLRVKRWVEVEYPPISLFPMGHCDIDSVDRRNCPGPTWPKERLLADLQEDDMDEATVKAIVDKAIADRSAKLASFAMTAGRFVAWKEAVGTPEEGPRFDAFYNLDIKWRVEDAIP